MSFSTETSPQTEPEFIGTVEAAEILGVSQQWIARLLKQGKLTGYRMGKQWAVNRQSVLDYKASRESSSE